MNMVDCMLKPAVDKRFLLLLAGIVWSGAGVLLIRFALRWLYAYPGPSTLTMLSFAGGIALGSAIGLLGFRHIARGNIHRIAQLPERSCLFAFQKWQGYLLVAFMMSLGMFIRYTQLFPPLLMATGYMGIGSALLGTSYLYYRELFNLRH